MLFVSLPRLTKTSLLHRKSYSDGTLECKGRLQVQVNSKAVANCERTKCAACEFGKDHRLYNKVNTTNKNPMKEQELNKDHLLPGHMVSADQYI